MPSFRQNPAHRTTAWMLLLAQGITPGLLGAEHSAADDQQPVEALRGGRCAPSGRREHSRSALGAAS